MILSTSILYEKEVSYRINPELEPELEKRVGKFHPIKDRIYDKEEFEEIIYSSKELEEMKVALHIKKDNTSTSVFKTIYNKMRGM